MFQVETSRGRRRKSSAVYAGRSRCLRAITWNGEVSTKNSFRFGVNSCCWAPQHCWGFFSCCMPIFIRCALLYSYSLVCPWHFLGRYGRLSSQVETYLLALLLAFSLS